MENLENNKIIKQILFRVIVDEKNNQRTKEKTDDEMVTNHIKTIKEISHAYKED